MESTAETLYEIVIPGAIIGYLDGTGVMQGDPYYGEDHPDERYAHELREAFRSAPTRHHGRGRSLKLFISAGAAKVLREYMYTDIDIIESLHSWEKDYSELGAARRVGQQINAQVPESKDWSW